MLSVVNLELHFGGRTLFEGANLQIDPGDRIGLVGYNGTGKTTLLRLISGEMQHDGGQIQRSKECTIGYLNQNLLSYQSQLPIIEVAMQAFERVLHLREKLDELMEHMATEYNDDIADRLAKLQTEYEMLDGYSVESRTAEILEGLGFNTAQLRQPLSSFSGGWRMRVMLAKLLLASPALLLLDEPTNHLDLPSIQWLENYLRNYNGALVIVSHDRRFLNATVTKIAEVTRRQLDVYTGNFDYYDQERTMRAEHAQKAFDNQQQQIKEMERFINRFRAKATKAKQVQSRIKELGRMDKIEMQDDQAPEMNIRFTIGRPSGREVVRLENVTRAYGPNVVIENSSAVVMRGQKIALIGANGKGKSTLLRVIHGKEPLKNGSVHHGHHVYQTFFAQHQLEALDVENSILEEMLLCGSGKTEQELRTVLGCFLFSANEVDKKIKVLSGGEKSRVALAKCLVSQANLLLLDEPTNHLDMLSVDLLVEAVAQYEGTVVLVSHDRDFVTRTADTVWYIDNRELKTYPGTFEEYLNKYGPGGAQDENSKPNKKKNTQNNNNAPKRTKDPNTAERKKLQKDLSKMERELTAAENTVADLEKKVATMETEMAKPDNLTDAEKIKKLADQHNGLKNDLEKATRRWETIYETTEGIRAEILSLTN